MSGGAVSRHRSLLTQRRAYRLVTVAIVAATLALNLVQQPGLITFDTKLDLQFAPGDFLSRSMSLWNGDSVVGGLQNQASGYLFPMGPVFWLGDVLHVPMAVWERLWSAAVMLIAYEGARRLASRWPGIGAWGAVASGLTYMLAPRILMTVGGLSGESLPAAVLPWTVLPLVLYLRGHVRGGLAFLWSAATVPLMGGQNATLVVACLLFPGLLLLLVEGRPWARRVRDLAVWGGLVVVSSLWWLIPLLLLGGYAPPFLDFIESAENTASSIGWMTSLRGTSHWVAFFPGGGTSGWAGGYALVSSSALLAATVLTAGAGLVGLALPGLWARRALVSAVLAGLVILTLGSGGPAGSILSEQWLGLLDGPLAPLRNIHKFDPLVRLPLSLGLGAFVSVGLPALVARYATLNRSRVSLARIGGTALVIAAVLAAALPAASGELRVTGGMRGISSSWRQAADYLDEQAGPASVLVLPGSGLAVQDWGRTIDEPIQVLKTPPWLARAQVTVAPAGTIRMLDSVADQIDEGRPQEELSDVMRRLGITYVVVRNDLDLDETGAPPPDVVYASLVGVAGLVSAASFGPMVDGHPKVEVFAVQNRPDDPRVTAMAADDVVVQGGPEVVDDLMSAGLVGIEQPTVLATDPAEPVDIVTDSNRRIERSFGRVHDANSAVMTADEPFRLVRPVHDYTGSEIPTALTTAEYEGASLVTASSSAGYADIIGPVVPDEAPYAAFDDSGVTAWVSAPYTAPQRQWIQAEFDEPRTLGRVSLRFDTTNGAAVTSVSIATDGGSVTAPVDSDGQSLDMALAAGSTTSLRVTIRTTQGERAEVRLVDVSIDGHEIRRSLRVPGEISSDTTAYLSSPLPRLACRRTGVGVSCARSGEAYSTDTVETTGFDRTLQVGEGVRWRLGGGRAVATNGPGVERLLAPLSDRQVSVTSTSTYGGDPVVAAANAFDGREDTGWYASPLDPAPALELSWRQKRVIKNVRADLAPGQPGDLPEVLVVDPMKGDGDRQLVQTSGPRAGIMKPVRTNRLRISAYPSVELTQGVGISELKIRELRDLRYSPDPSGATGVVCGFGPTVQIGDVTVQTKLTGSLSDVAGGSELELEPCGTAAITVPSGVQRIRVTNPAGFAVSRLWLEPENRGDDVAATPPTVEVEHWSPTRRTVAVQARSDALIVLPQSYNRGWSATLDGTRLDPKVVDGWKQAWDVPAGSSGEVQMVFEPQSRFVISIVAGLALAALLGLAALVTLVLARQGAWAMAGPSAAPSLEGLDAASFSTLGPRHRRLTLVGVIAAGAVLAVVSVPLAIGAAVGFVLRRAGSSPLVATVVIGLTAAVLVVLTGDGTAIRPSATSDILVALVVGSICGTTLRRTDDRWSESS